MLPDLMSRDTESIEHGLLRAAYRDFNARNFDELLAKLHPQVEWANGWEGGHVQGRDAVRAYWTRQLDVLDPRVEPMEILTGETGWHTVKVHQVVRNRDGELLVDTVVYHSYKIAERMIVRMDILSNAPNDEQEGP
jgi:hypothetical protein